MCTSVCFVFVSDLQLNPHLPFCSCAINCRYCHHQIHYANFVLVTTTISLSPSCVFQSIVHSKKTEPWQPQLVGWYERRPLHDPNKVFAYWSKKKTTTFGAKTIVLFKNLGTGCCSQPLPSEHRCVWPLKALLSCYWAFFRLHGCHFSGWGSRVGGLLISETSIFTIDNGDEARKGRTTEPWRSPPNRQRRSAFKKARLLWQKKKFRNPLLYQHISGFLLSSSLHRTSAVGSNGPRFESGRGRCVESLDKVLYSHCPKEKPSH